ncbi:MAG TPA: hypothetical protein VFZ34_06785 [Blastocatellia bacterium]|nr:hypothetical protein [Blastocatellia bacterium]
MSTTKILIAIFCLFTLSLAAAKPNLSGTWKLDKDRSFSNAPGLDQTMTIVHNGNEVKLDAKVTVQGREQQISETWTIDNQEHEFTPPGAAPGAKGKRKASWLPNDKGILVEDETMVKTPNGEVQQRTTRKYTLAADGASLIVDYFVDRGAVSVESKRVFAKQ